MAISRARKEELVAEYRQHMTESSGVIMADYTALTTPQLENVRQRARELDGQVFIVKNTLLQMVLEEQGIKVPENFMTGPTIAVFCHQDVPPLAKLFRDFAREMEEGRFKVKGGVLDGQIISAADAIAVADLPSREVVMSQVLRAINAPASQMVGVVASGIRQVLNVLQAYVDKLEESGGASAEAAA